MIPLRAMLCIILPVCQFACVIQAAHGKISEYSEVDVDGRCVGQITDEFERNFANGLRYSFASCISFSNHEARTFYVWTKETKARNSAGAEESNEGKTWKNVSACAARQVDNARIIL